MSGSDARAELAGDQGVGGAETGGKLGGGQTAVVVEPAEMSFDRQIALLEVAFATARDEVAEGIVLQLDERDDMIDAAGRESQGT